jgi:diacylglycerol O-acyltransferase / wax synthase
LYAELLRFDDPRPLFRRRPRDPVSSVGNLFWTDDGEVDLEHQVRLTALPRPGRVRELLALVSRLHGSLLDRHRPLWEFSLIEGLEGGRFATYGKMHHALVDGVSASRLLTTSLSTDPAVATRPFWAAGPRTGPPPARDPLGPLALLRDAAGLGPALARLAAELLRGQVSAVPFPAPATAFNVPITGARRFAAQSWPIDRLKKAGAPSGATLNDVVLAMCAGALRRYLLAANELPDRPLVAAVPVSLRDDDAVAGGNQLSVVLCNLATTVADPRGRLETIRASMHSAKAAVGTLSRGQSLLLGAALLGAPVMAGAIPGALGMLPRPYNLIISNVPGPPEQLYFHGARLVGNYPVSIPFEGQALNITVMSYAGNMEFGLIGCRRSVPHLQHLLGYLEDSLAELED